MIPILVIDFTVLCFALSALAIVVMAWLLRKL